MRSLYRSIRVYILAKTFLCQSILPQHSLKKDNNLKDHHLFFKNKLRSHNHSYITLEHSLMQRCSAHLKLLDWVDKLSSRKITVFVNSLRYVPQPKNTKPDCERMKLIKIHGISEHANNQKKKRISLYYLECKHTSRR